MILSTYVSNDGKARADVHLVGKRLAVVCKTNGVQRVRLGMSPKELDAAEDFAEDFVSENNNKKVNDYGIYSGESSVLY